MFVDALVAQLLRDKLGAELRNLRDRDLVERHLPEPRFEMVLEDDVLREYLGRLVLTTTTHSCQNLPLNHS
jgi:hypothetical protein